MAKKTVPFNMRGIEDVPNDKPAVYIIRNWRGKPNYIGSAKRFRVRQRLLEHLPGGMDHVPGQVVQVEQMSNIDEAKKKETMLISRLKPPYNKAGK